MQNPVVARLLPVGLLIFSNLFMMVAWYGHLKYKSKPLLVVIVVSWGIAFFEYCLQVPANRWGNAVFSATQLKVLQEIVTLMVFSAFAILYLNERMRWNHAVAFGFIVGAVIFAFLPSKG